MNLFRPVVRVLTLTINSLDFYFAKGIIDNFIIFIHYFYQIKLNIGYIAISLYFMYSIFIGSFRIVSIYIEELTRRLIKNTSITNTSSLCHHFQMIFIEEARKTTKKQFTCVDNFHYIKHFHIMNVWLYYGLFRCILLTTIFNAEIVIELCRYTLLILACPTLE